MVIARADENTESGAFAATGLGSPVRLLAKIESENNAVSIKKACHLVPAMLAFDSPEVTVASSGDELRSSSLPWPAGTISLSEKLSGRSRSLILPASSCEGESPR